MIKNRDRQKDRQVICPGLGVYSRSYCRHDVPHVPDRNCSGRACCVGKWKGPCSEQGLFEYYVQKEAHGDY